MKNAIILVLTLIILLFLWIGYSESNFHSNDTLKGHPMIDRSNVNTAQGWKPSSSQSIFAPGDSIFLSSIPHNINLKIKRPQIFHLELDYRNKKQPSFVALCGTPNINWFTGKGSIDFEIVHEQNTGQSFWKIDTIIHKIKSSNKCFDSYFIVKLEETDSFEETTTLKNCSIDTAAIRNGHLSDMVVSHDEPKGCKETEKDITSATGDVRICKVAFGR